MGCDLEGAVHGTSDSISTCSGSCLAPAACGAHARSTSASDSTPGIIQMAQARARAAGDSRDVVLESGMVHRVHARGQRERRFNSQDQFGHEPCVLGFAPTGAPSSRSR